MLCRKLGTTANCYDECCAAPDGIGTLQVSLATIPALLPTLTSTKEAEKLLDTV